MEWMIIGEFQELSENYKPIKEDLKEDEAFRLKMFKPGYQTIATKKLVSSSTKDSKKKETEESSSQQCHESFELKVVFDSKPWLYPIDNGKKTRDRRHCYVISIYKPTSQQRQLELVGRFHSSSFLLSPTIIQEKTNQTSYFIPACTSSDEEENDEMNDSTAKMKMFLPEKKQQRKKINHSQLAQKKETISAQQQEDRELKPKTAEISSSVSHSEDDKLDNNEELILHQVSQHHENRWSSLVFVRIPSSSPSTTSEEDLSISDQRRRTVTTLQYLLSSSAGISSPLRKPRVAHNLDEIHSGSNKRGRDNDDLATSQKAKHPNRQQREKKNNSLKRIIHGSHKEFKHLFPNLRNECNLSLDWFQCEDEEEFNDLPIFSSFPSFDISHNEAVEPQFKSCFCQSDSTSLSPSLFHRIKEEPASDSLSTMLLQSPRKRKTTKEQELLLSITPPQRKQRQPMEREMQLTATNNHILSPSKLSFDEN
jgi:hypothetical protein